MAQVINEMDVPSHSFVFHGTGERYFLICVVNVLLTIITLGKVRISGEILLG